MSHPGVLILKLTKLASSRFVQFIILCYATLRKFCKVDLAIMSFGYRRSPLAVFGTIGDLREGRKKGEG